MSEISQTIPARFGAFFLYDLIGRGGMAEIFLAKTFTSLGTERQAVIKRILPYLSNNEHFGEMLIQEAKLCARLSHANVVQTYDLGKIDNRFYIAMEYVEGFDLNQLLGMMARAKLALPLPFALYIIKDSLKGLDYAHRLSDQGGNSLGIIHRDVSPTNILISTQGEVKVCDFGIAKVTLSNLGVDNLDEYHLKGKVAYMAPEHLNGETVDRRADLYAAGILLWELLNGRRLFKRKDDDETMRLSKEAKIPPLKNRGFGEFDLLETIVQKALSKNPDDRFQTGQEFISALDDYMHSASLIVSQLKFSEFLMNNFGENLLQQRSERERGLAELSDFRAHLDSYPPKNGTSPSPEADAILATFKTEPDESGDHVASMTDTTASPLDDDDDLGELDEGALLEDIEEYVYSNEPFKEDDLDSIEHAASASAVDSSSKETTPKPGHSRAFYMVVAAAAAAITIIATYLFGMWG